MDYSASNNRQPRETSATLGEVRRGLPLFLESLAEASGVDIEIALLRFANTCGVPHEELVREYADGEVTNRTLVAFLLATGLSFDNVLSYLRSDRASVSLPLTAPIRELADPGSPIDLEQLFPGLGPADEFDP